MWPFSPPHYWIFLHHKCASLWLQEMIAAAGVTTKKLSAIAQASHEDFRAPLTPTQLEKAGRSPYALVFNARSSTPEMLDQIRDATGRRWRGVNFIRDPRDLVVSAYWSHRNSHPLKWGDTNWWELAEHRKRLKKLGLAAGLIAEMEFYVTRQAVESILNWPYYHPAVKTVCAIRAAGDRVTLAEALRWIGIPWTEAVEKHFLARAWVTITSRGRGTEDQASHYRKGVVGDWVEYWKDRKVAQAWARIDGGRTRALAELGILAE